MRVAANGSSSPRPSMITGAPDEAHVRARVDESARVGDCALFDQERPQLPRQVELGVDLDRSGDINAAVLALRRVIQFAVRGVAGSSVVPALGALECAIVKR